VGETVRHHEAARAPLHAVVADLSGGVQTLFDIALLQDVALIMGVMCPHARQTVGLQLQHHRQAIGLALASGALGLGHLARDAEQVLYVMAHLVGDDIGLAEFRGQYP
jgi:hypothetical protein